MPRSTLVLVIHCLIFVIFVLASLTSPLLLMWNPTFYDYVFFPIYAGLALGAMIGWLPCLGRCAITRLENIYRKLENKPVYQEEFALHYINEWVSEKAENRVVSPMLFAIMFLPVIVWII